MITWVTMTVIDLLVRVAVSLGLGGLIGLERQLRGQPAGFRTHILVCLGSTVFTLASVHGFDPLLAQRPGAMAVDPSRIAAQIVVGIGFLGAGAIIRHGASVRGLTTAASLWTVAALGLVVGLGWYSLAGITTAAVVLGLTGLRIVEERLIFPRTHTTAQVEVVFKNRRQTGLTEVVAALDSMQIQVHELKSDRLDSEANHVELLLELPRGAQPAQVVERLTSLASVDSVVLR